LPQTYKKTNDKQIISINLFHIHN